MPKRRRSREFKNNRVIDIEAARQERRERRKSSAACKPRKTKPRQELSRRQVIKSLRRRIIYSLIFIVIGVIIGASVYNIITLKMEEAAAQAQLDVLEAEKRALEQELSLVDSKEYIEQQAREQLRMILPGEILYVLKQRDVTKDETAD